MLFRLLMTLATFASPILVDQTLEASSSVMAASGERTQQFDGYDAIDSNAKRKPAKVENRSEDLILDPSKRAKLTATTRDIIRNFAAAEFAVRRHLDYVASFDFHSNNDNDELDDRIEFLMERDSRPGYFDQAGRHGRSRFLRLVESHATVDGDIGVVRLTDGTLQGLEGDRIRNPRGGDVADLSVWTHGVKTNGSSRALAYAVHSRTSSGFKFERTVSAANLFLHGNYRRFDQIRGVSPIAAALNQFRDLYTNVDLALAKAKVSQLFAMIVQRQAIESMGEVDGEDRSDYKVNFGGGPFLLDLDPGDDAKFLTDQNPSTQFQSFCQVVLMAALKSLDIPYSFYDESHTNFFGSRGAWLHYERSCKSKRENLQELLRWYTIWKHQLWILNGELELPKGWTIGDLAWEWSPTGMPWWKPSEEIRGELMACAAGLDNLERVAKEHGKGDVYKNIDINARVMKYAKDEHDMKLSIDGGPAPAVINVGDVEDLEEVKS